MYSPLTNKPTDEEHPSPTECMLYATANGESQTVANVDPKIVDADGCASYLHGEIVTYKGHRKGIAPSSSAGGGGVCGRATITK